MALNERQQQDIVGWLTGFGTDEANASAARLIETDPEASAFARDIRAIIAMLSVSSDASDRTGEAKAHAITRDILDRWRTERESAGVNPNGVRVSSVGRSHRLNLFFMRYAAMAAVLVLLVSVTWVFFLAGDSFESAKVGQITFHSIGGLAVPGVETVPVVAGQRVRTGQRQALLALQDRSLVVFPTNSSALVGEEGRIIALESGRAFIRQPARGRYLVVDGDTTVEAAELLVTVGKDELMWHVYRGNVRICVGEDVLDVSEPTLVMWLRSRHAFHTQPLESDVPPWATRLINAHNWK